MRMLRRLIGILVLVMVVLVMVQVVGAAGEVTWYWKDTNAAFSHPTAANYKFHKLMDKTEPTGTTDYTVTLGPSESAWWYTDEAAECDLTFPAGKWAVRYWAEASGDDGKHPVYARLYVVHTDGSATKIIEKYSWLAPEDGLVEKTRTLSPSSIDVNTGERLAIQIEWYHTADLGDTLTIHYNHNDYKSRLISPSSSPVCPVPELSTLVLLSIGLITLAGYVLLTRRRK